MMVEVARLSLTGMFAGIPQVLRQVSGRQQFQVRFTALIPETTKDLAPGEKPGAYRFERECLAPEPIFLHELGRVAAEMTAEFWKGEDPLVVRALEWRAYMHVPGKTRKKRKGGGR